MGNGAISSVTMSVTISACLLQLSTLLPANQHIMHNQICTFCIVPLQAP
jgi:hypothetical protein